MALVRVGLSTVRIAINWLHFRWTVLWKKNFWLEPLEIGVTEPTRTSHKRPIRVPALMSLCVKSSPTVVPTIFFSEYNFSRYSSSSLDLGAPASGSCDAGNEASEPASDVVGCGGGGGSDSGAAKSASILSWTWTVSIMPARQCHTSM